MLPPRVSSTSPVTADIRCQDCIVDHIGHCDDLGKQATCPSCDQGPLRVSDLRTVQRRRRRANPFEDASSQDTVTIGKVDLVSSTKLRALVRKLESLRHQEPVFKALVFSQFTSFLGTSCVLYGEAG